MYPRGLNEKQHTNNNIAIFLKYVSGTMPTIKAKAEFSVVSRNNELVMLRSTNFHTFSSGNDWGYSGRAKLTAVVIFISMFVLLEKNFSMGTISTLDATI